MLNRRTILCSPLLAVLSLCLYYSVQLGLSDLYFSSADAELNFWARQNYRPDQKRVNATQENISTALANWPRNPDYMNAKARLLGWQTKWAEEASQRETLSRQVMSTRIDALDRRPAHRKSWFDLAGEKARLGENDAVWSEAIEKARMLNRAKE